MTALHCGLLLKQHRTHASLTLRRLAQLADVKHSNIALIESGKKTCGPTVAAKLANALHLDGQSRVEFLVAASGTTKRPLARSRGGVTSQDLLAMLKVLTVALEPVKVREKDFARISASATRQHLIVETADGRTFWLSLHLEKQQLLNLEA